MEPAAREPASAGFKSLDPDELRTVEQAVRVAANAMFLARRDGRICWINEAFTKLYGYTEDEVLGLTPRVLKSGRQSAPFYRDLWTTISAGQVWRGHLSNRRKDGAIFDVEQTITPVLDERGEVAHFLTVYEDITERLRSEQRITRLAMFDSLTGLPNRNQFEVHVSEALARSRRSGKPFAVMMIDLDHFKNVNDTLGHAGGDELLAQAGRCMSSTLRETDLVARLSGDEFAVLLEELARPEQAVDSAQRLLDVLSTPFRVHGAMVQIGASIGISLSGDGEDTPERLLKNADLAMYQAKSRGRARFQFFDAAMDIEARKRHATDLALRQALRRDEFGLVYQPQVDLRSGAVVGAEAFLRWNDPPRGSVQAAEFISIAEHDGMLFALNDWVLRNAIAQLAKFHRLVNGMPRVAVNVSAAQFDQVGLGASIGDLLRRHGLPAAALNLEVPEAVLLRPGSVVRDNLIALSELGVRLIVDGLGTGATQLSALRDLPFDSIALDARLIRGIGRSQRDEQFLKGIIALAHGLDIDVTAKGIEKVEQRSFLMRSGCRYGQGYLFSPERSFVDFVSKLRNGTLTVAPAGGADGAQKT